MLLPARVATAQEIALAEADRRTSAVARLLRKRKTPNAALVAGVESIEEAYRKPPQKEEPKRVAHARRAMRKVLLRALVASGRIDAQMRNPREPVQWRAARALRWMVPGDAATIHKAVERGLCKDAKYDISARVWEALCDSLLRQNPDRGYLFVVERLVHPDNDLRATLRTHAALVALAAAPLPNAKIRHVTVKRFLAVFQSYPFHVEEDYDYVGDFRNIKRGFKQKLARHGHYWAEIRPLVLRMLRRLTADPVTGELVRGVHTDFEIESLEQFKVWNGRNKLRPIAQWTKEPGEPTPRTMLRPARMPVREFGLRWTMPWTDRWPQLVAERDRDDELLAKRKAMRETTLQPLLQAALVDADPEVRGMAAIVLGRIRAPKATATLRERLTKETDENVREAVAFGLLYVADAKLRDWWRSVVQDDTENPQVRAIGVLALAFLGDAAFLRMHFADDAKPWSSDRRIETELRASAIAGITIAGAPADAPLLFSLLLAKRAPSAEFGAAAAALASHATAIEADPLLMLLRGARVRTRKPARTAAIAHALGGALQPGDAKRLRKAAHVFLQNGGKFAAHRTEVALSLGRIGGPIAFELLAKGYEGCRKDGDRSAETGYFLLAMAMTGDRRAPDQLAAAFAELPHEFDASACALALARSRALRHAPLISARLDSATRGYVPYSIEALGRLGDVAALPAIRARIESDPRDQALGAGGIAIARIRGDKAGSEILPLWVRAGDRREYDALARAFGIAGPDGSEMALMGMLTDRKTRSARERAYALAALGRMASPDERIATRLRAAYFAYGAPRALTRLARFGDSFFLAATDE